MIIDDDGKWLDEPEGPEKKKRGSKSEESHHPRFKGVFIPGELWERFQAGKINPREFLLVAIIDALANHRKGCFASNAWLAKQIRVSPSRVTHMLTTLKKLGYVKQIDFDGRKRILGTKWSRTEKPFRGENLRVVRG